jgi:hypothetical protein
MKKQIIFLVLAFTVSFTMAQSPLKFNYQGVARNNSGTELKNQSLGLRMSLHQLSGSGTIVYQEKHTVSTNNFGLFTIKVGSGTILSGDFTKINWADGPYFIEIEVDITGGTSYTSMGAAQLISVPYALYAENAGKMMKAGAGITIKGDSVINSAPDKVVNLNGTGGTIVTGSYPSYTINTPINQTLKYSNDSLYITNGNSVIVKSDKTLNLTAGGSTTITGTYPNFTISSTGGTVNLTGSGGTVITGNAPNYNINTPWYRNGLHLYTSTGGNVGIGTANPTVRLMIKDTLSTAKPNSFILDAKGGSITSGYYRGMNSTIRGTDGNNRAVQGNSMGISIGNNVGLAGFADSGYVNIGVVGNSSATNSISGGFNIGLNAAASNSLYSNIAVGGYATGGTANVDVNYALVGLANSGTSATGTNYGIYTTAANGTNNYAGYFDGDVTVTGTFTNPSDIGLKSDVNDLNGALTILNKLHPVSYFYDKKENKYIKLPENLQYGFIAQELEKVIPDLVKVQVHPVRTVNPDIAENAAMPDKITYKGINYIGLIPLLTKGIQEQQTEIDQLKVEIEILKAEIRKLKE